MHSSYFVFFMLFIVLHHQNRLKKLFMKQLMKRRNSPKTVLKSGTVISSVGNNGMPTDDFAEVAHKIKR